MWKYMENQLWTNFSLILQIKIFWTLAHKIVPYVLFVEIRAQTQMQKPMCATKHACIFLLLVLSCFCTDLWHFPWLVYFTSGPQTPQKTKMSPLLSHTPHHIPLCGMFFKYLTLSALGGAGPSIAWGGVNLTRTFLQLPGGLMGHNSFNFNHYIV